MAYDFNETRGTTFIVGMVSGHVFFEIYHHCKYRHCADPIDEFISRITHTHYEDKIIGELLLNQRFVAGVSNIYKAEALFQAKVNPLRKVATLTNNDLEQLDMAISEVM